jgi:hypothetical protein
MRKESPPMKCEKCDKQINEDDEGFRYSGRVLCEDCYIDIVSPPKACDPWAVYIAKSTIGTESGSEPVLSDRQNVILAALRETGGVEPEVLSVRVGLKLPELERELATLRHMEKIKGALRDGRRIILLW